MPPVFRVVRFSLRQTFYVRCESCGWTGPERVLPVGKGIDNDKTEHRCKEDEMPVDDDGPNTEVFYQYRDASNYKQAERVVFAGRLTADELIAVMTNLDNGQWFIPSQVGLPDLQGRWGGRLYEDDHVWHELEAGDITPTWSAPTEAVDVHAFAAAFAAARWDVEAAMREVGITA